MKDSGALADLMAKKPGKLEKGFAPSPPEDSAASLSFRSVAKAFGIPPEKQAAAEAALRAFVKTCGGGKGYGDDTDDIDEL